ncbi:MAG: transglycosylase family protein [Actinomycetota bacterium]
MAEHRSRAALSCHRVLTVALVVALTSLPVAAGAQSTEDRIDDLRAAIDGLAVDWFAHQAEASRIDAEIAELELWVAAADDRAGRAAEVAQGHALEIYKGSETALTPVLGGSDALDTARRAELFDSASAESRAAIDALTTAAEDLETTRAALSQRRDDQRRTAATLAAQQEELVAQLATLEDQAAAEAAAEAAAAAERARAAAARRARPRAAPARSTEPAGAAAPAPSSGVHPQHGHPFLSCTRERESRGDYGAVNPAGYYGAYQFAPTTWDVTANRAGRIDLVGVLASRAGPYDQDELAWVLYQWQGDSPWGGRC